jgi:hypothetical protein
MRITLAPPGPDGRRELMVGAEGEPGWFTWDATQHQLDDLAAVLAADKAMARTCPAATGDHTCGLPPGPHYAATHVCRACPHTWTQP